MKKIFKALFIATLAFATTVTVSSCTKDDPGQETPSTPDDPDDPDEPQPEDQGNLESATVTLTYYVNQQMLETYEISAVSAKGDELAFSTTPVDITFSDGSTIPMYSVKVNVTEKSFPAVGIRLKYTLKDGYTLPEVSDFAMAWVATGSAKYDKAGDVKYQQVATYKHFSVKAEKIHDFTERLMSSYSVLDAVMTQDGIDLSNSGAN